MDVAGTYNLVITDTNNNCTATDTVEVVGYTTPVATITSNVTDNQLSCSVDTITLTANDIDEDSTYSRNNDAGNEQSIDVTTSGTYTLTVTNEYSCSNIAEYTISENYVAPSFDLPS